MKSLTSEVSKGSEIWGRGVSGFSQEVSGVTSPKASFFSLGQKGKGAGSPSPPRIVTNQVEMCLCFKVRKSGSLLIPLVGICAETNFANVWTP